MVAIESELFLLGMWKDYQELEDSISMPELTAILVAKRKKEFDQNKFFAALQGVDLDEGIEENSGQRTFEDIKAKAFSGGAAESAKDILSLQGKNAQQEGFGIGLGLEYSDLKSETAKGPFG